MPGALLMIDLQIDFLSRRGRLPISADHVGEVLCAANEAAVNAQERGWPIAAIGNEFRKSAVLANLLRNFAAQRGSAGAKWDPRAPQQVEAYFAKRSADAFSNPELDRWLRHKRVTSIHLCGVMAGACVAATAKAGLKLGYEVKLIERGIGAQSARSRLKALEQLLALGCTLSDLA